MYQYAFEAMKYLKFPDMSESGGPPNVTGVVRKWTDELLIQQGHIPDR
jgi:hypothetical protein